MTKIRNLLACTTPIFTVLALWAVCQTLFLPNGLYGNRASGPLLDPNTLATVLNIGLLILTGTALYTDQKNHKILFTVLALITFAGLIATASRSGLIAALISLATLFRCSRIRPDWKPGLAACTIAFGLPVLSARPFWSNMANLLSPSGDISVGDRLSLWRASWRMMLDHFWIGTGPGTFAFYYPAYREPGLDRSLGTFTHLDPLQMGVETGIAGPILFYALLSAVLLRTIQALEITANQSQRLQILVPFTALLAVALQAHVNFPLYMMPVLIACGALLAFWHRATCDVLDNGETSITLGTLRGRIAFRSAIAVVALLILTLSGMAAGGNYFLRLSQSLKNPQSSLLALAWAEGLGPQSFIDPEVDMAKTNLDLIDRSGKIKSPHLKDGLLRETARLLDAASAWNPAWAEIDYLRGEAAQIKGQKSIMLDSWFTALKKNPMHFQTRVDLAQALLKDGRTKDAARVVTDGLNYPHPLSYREWAVSFLKSIAP